MNGVAASLVGLTTNGVGNCSTNSSSNSSVAGELLGSGDGTSGLVNTQSVLSTHLHTASDDEDEDMPSSPESFDEDGVSFIGPDDVTAQLAAAGGWTGEICIRFFGGGY